jgi:hypothetical protein
MAEREFYKEIIVNSNITITDFEGIKEWHPQNKILIQP